MKSNSTCIETYMNEVSPRIADGEDAAAALGTVMVLEMIEVGVVMVAMFFFFFFLGDRGEGKVVFLCLF